jgi:hypothetical protein
MALSKSVNSNATVAEADAYFDGRLDVAAWTQADTTEKEKALITATSLLDVQEWVGSAVSVDQPLAFPRVGEYLDPRLGMCVPLNGAGVPDRVVKATYELAYHLLNNDGLLDDTGKVESLNIAGVSLTNIRATPKIPDFVKRLIRPLLQNKGSRAWWRAN